MLLCVRVRVLSHFRVISKAFPCGQRRTGADVPRKVDDSAPMMATTNDFQKIYTSIRLRKALGEVGSVPHVCQFSIDDVPTLCEKSEERLRTKREHPSLKGPRGMYALSYFRRGFDTALMYCTLSGIQEARSCSVRVSRTETSER